MEPNIPPIVVMGVSGSGKSTIGMMLGEALDRPFIDGDDLHPPANKEKMRRGEALNDEDRAPWFAILGQALIDSVEAGRPAVIASSALKRRYRDTLRAQVPGLAFVHLDGGAELIGDRIAHRTHEYMPSSLLGSQFATLEPLADDEAGVRVSIDASPEEIVRTTIDRLRSATPGESRDDARKGMST